MPLEQQLEIYAKIKSKDLLQPNKFCKLKEGIRAFEARRKELKEKSTFKKSEDKLPSVSNNWSSTFSASSSTSTLMKEQGTPSSSFTLNF